MPAQKGMGLVAQRELQKILRLAGIQDIWTKTYGNTAQTVNLDRACVDALNKLVETEVKPEYIQTLGLCEGKRDEHV